EKLPTDQFKNNRKNVCSTWGNFHFKTFDNELYQFKGGCTYNLLSHCQDSYQEFSVFIKRDIVEGHPLIDKITISIKDVIINLRGKTVFVNNQLITEPYYNYGILIYNNTAYLNVQTKVGLNIFYNQEDAVMLELDPKFMNKTCGLCGDYNGVSRYTNYTIL
uniref:VWFD domain-containing protein n=1 Tax=Xenopus tropicalis TaxID=8364 RepID=A0A6I8SIS1_XENTR